MEIVVSIFLILITIIAIVSIYKDYKEYRKMNLEMLFWLIVVIIAIPEIIYYVDRLDIPSKFNWFENSDSVRWFNFIYTYISSIFGATIGAVALILMTRKEMDVIRENDIEQRRIDNLPLLKYSVDFVPTVSAIDSIILPSFDNCEMLSIKFGVKNIGMNAIRDCSIVKIKYLNGKMWKDSLDNGQLIIEKGEHISKFIYFPVQKDDTQLTVIMQYQDILSNWYEQEIKLDVSIYFSGLSNTMKPSGSIRIVAKKEKMIEKNNKD